MALSVVDAHVRERLIWLRQQQEDMTILLSQVSTACLHCEKTLQQVGNTTCAFETLLLEQRLCLWRPFAVAGRLQGRAGQTGDQLFAGDAPEAAAPVHRARRPHSAGCRDSCHLHQGTLAASCCTSTVLQRHVSVFSRTTGSTSARRWRSVWWLWGWTELEKPPSFSSWNKTSSCSRSRPLVRTLTVARQEYAACLPSSD